MPPAARFLTTTFQRIYVLNLPERADRRREMAAEMARLGLGLDRPPVRLFPAVRPAEKGEWPSIGARGCFLSHLGAIREAVADGLTAVAILEDDANWTRGFLTADEAALARIASADWNFLHGGPAEPAEAAGPPAAAVVPPAEGLLTTHLIGLRGEALRAVGPYLEAMAARPGGDPRGGPMHVDGAYSWFRRDHPDIPAATCHPGLAYQRSSRTDIHALGWLDRAPGLATLTGWSRRLRNKLMRGW